MPSRALMVAWRGALVSGLNPRGCCCSSPCCRSCVRPDAAWPASVQLAAFGCLHVLACAVVYALVAVTARAVLATRRRAGRRMELTSAALMTGLGLLLAAEQTLTHG